MPLFYLLCQEPIKFDGLLTLRVIGVTGGEFGGGQGVGPSVGPGAKINPDCSKLA